MSQQKIDLELFKEEGLTSEEDIKVVTIFETAFDSLSKTSLDELAKSTALELQQLMSPDMTADKQEYFFECTWEVLIGIAKHVPHRHDAQHLLVAVVQVLRTTPQWEDLPHFGRCMRDNWIDPATETAEGHEENTYSFAEWLNLNSFVSRLFGAGTVGWENFPIWQLSDGLEEELSPGLSTDNRVAVASEWLIQASPDLLRRCLQEKDGLDEAQKRSYGPGKLFAGHPGLGLERWGFWKQRLGEIQSVVSSGESVASAVQALESMKAATDGVLALISS